MVDKATVLEKMASFLRHPVEKLRDDVLLSDLVLESFILIEMVIELQEALGVRFGQEELKDVKTVGDLTRMIERVSEP